MDVTATVNMSDLPIPPYLLEYLPYLAVCLAMTAFVLISLPLAKKSIAGTQLRRQSIIAIIVAAVAMFHGGLATWEFLVILGVGGVFVAIYYQNHLGRKRIAQAIAAEKAAARKAQLASFLSEVEQDAN